MKLYTTIKVGYSYSKSIGCTGEIFTTIAIDDNKQESFTFEGLYGAEERINAEIEKLGYKGFYTSSRYGQMKREDKRGVMSEYTALEYVKNGFKNLMDCKQCKTKAEGNPHDKICYACELSNMNAERVALKNS